MSSFRFLSEPIVVLTLPISTLRKGSANNTTFALPPIEVELEVERRGVAHAVCYWYRITMVDPGSAFLSDSSITSAIKKSEMNNTHKHENQTEKVEYKNGNRNDSVKEQKSSYVSNSKTRSVSENGNKKRNEKEIEKEKKKLNELFPYTLDTGPYGTERLRKLECHTAGGREGEDESREEENERKNGKEREINDEHKMITNRVQNNSSVNMRESTLLSSSQSPSQSQSQSHPPSTSTSPSISSFSSHTGQPTHYRQAATLLKEAVTVSPEDTVLIEVGIDICFGVLCRVISHFT